MEETNWQRANLWKSWSLRSDPRKFLTTVRIKKNEEFRTNAILNFCAFKPEKNDDTESKKIEFTNCKNLFKVTINRIPLQPMGGALAIFA